MSLPRRSAVVAGLAATALVLSACAQSERDAPEDGEAADETGATAGAEDSASGGTFVFGAAGAPASFDPFYASDGETFRVTRQMYDGLLQFTPGTSDVQGALAETWESSEDGLTWTFNIREDATFHDDTPVNAEAICANFDRWYDQNEVGSLSAVAYYYNSDWGFEGDDPLYESCEATEEFTATLTLTRATSRMPTMLATSSYAIASPTALEEFNANDVQQEGEAFVYPEFATTNPVGSGAFSFGSYDEANGTVTLERNPDYWGEVSNIDELVFRIIPDETTRRQELSAGTIDGYDLPNPVDWGELESEGNTVEIRPVFNILYLAFNPTTNEALLDDDVRRALGMAINRQQLVDTQLPDDSSVATQFIPPTVEGYNEELEALPYDPEQAQQLLADAGYEDLTIELWWPTEVTRPYMPDPQRIYEAVVTDWEAAGITVETISRPWNGGYLDGVQSNQAASYFLGWTGDYNSAGNFLGSFFEASQNNFATHEYPWGQELSDLLAQADANPDPESRIPEYQEINANISEWLPGIPISHSPPALVVREGVTGITPSPLTDERFNTVVLED